MHVDDLPLPRPQTVFASSSYETVGSTGAGKALNLARLGHEVHLHTLIGDDDVGRGVIDTLTSSGVHVHPALTSGPTEQHVNVMAADGSRLSIYPRQRSRLPSSPFSRSRRSRPNVTWSC